MTSVAPASVVARIWIGPTSQPMSVIQSIRSVALRSKQSRKSSPVFTAKPQWVWTVPLGFPVVPDV